MIWKCDVVSQNGHFYFVVFRKRERLQRRTTEIQRDLRYFNLNFVKSDHDLNSPPLANISISTYQLDMASLLPFDLLYLQFGFKSIFRANRLLKVNFLTFLEPSID